jgi:hypothetical protein
MNLTLAHPARRLLPKLVTRSPVLVSADISLFATTNGQRGTAPADFDWF